MHEAIVTALRVSEITDPETSVGLDETEAGMKSNAADFGGDLHRGSSLTRDTAREQAKVMTETQLQTEAVARAHRQPVTTFPCDWTSLMTEFKGRNAKRTLRKSYQH